MDPHDVCVTLMSENPLDKYCVHCTCVQIMNCSWVLTTCISQGFFSGAKWSKGMLPHEFIGTQNILSDILVSSVCYFTPSLASLLPTGKRYHLFVTHSTSDQQWARDCIVSRLSGSWKVKACYQLMPDQSRYDDAGIKDAMRQSCVILIGLSPAYIRSGR